MFFGLEDVEAVPQNRANKRISLAVEWFWRPFVMERDEVRVEIAELCCSRLPANGSNKKRFLDRWKNLSGGEE